MSEFHLSLDPTPQNLHNRGVPGTGQQPTQMEWYSSSSSAYGTSTAYDTPGNIKDHGTTSYGDGFEEDEPPLLEELGIDIPTILRRMRSVMLYRLGSFDIHDVDLGGPLLFVTAMAAIHLLTGKLHFGVCLGWSVVCSMSIWFVLNNLKGFDADEQKPLDLYGCCCLFGYGLLPLVFYSLFALLMPKAVVSYALAALALLWSTRTGSQLYIKRSPALQEHSFLVAYCCLVAYAAFTLLAVY